MAMLQENTTNRAQVLNGDYAGILGVFHHLHCLDTIRRVLHWDHYGPRASEQALRSGVYSKEHSDHCLDGLRQAVMCHANTDFYSAEWISDSTQPMSKELRSEGKQRCVNWESLDVWARSRALIPGHYNYRLGPYEASQGL
ncbi:hypothetical protein BDV95DRAFT_635637 [Massariosphaeria phaeospora]|uniref:Tat pathway signal sequence n=1 Tax=Massariosphaeria phaeospora TaxID=100035 RepID=A0A7C8I8J9_9PLEO|nr:hypothetical protein BDV95DRAFT_635637 [Massariosphaeria phaeospora]